MVSYPGKQYPGLEDVRGATPPTSLTFLVLSGRGTR